MPYLGVDGVHLPLRETCFISASTLCMICSFMCAQFYMKQVFIITVLVVSTTQQLFKWVGLVGALVLFSLKKKTRAVDLIWPTLSHPCSYDGGVHRFWYSLFPVSVVPF